MRVLLLCLLFISYPILANTFFDNKTQGWFWYQDPKIEAPKPKKSPPKIQAPSAAMPALSPTQQMEALNKRVTDTLNMAILNPTEANLREYAKVYYEVIDKGQHFSDAYKIMLMKNPEFDYSLKFPTNHNARAVYDKQESLKTQQAIRQFAQNHGFFFFFSSNCEYCHHFAPTLKRFADKYGIYIMPISMDGGGLPEFPKPARDNGTARALNVTSWPALYAVNTKTKQIVPITNGVVSVSELEERVVNYVQYNQKHGTKY
jgi:conjugal transfer pilus assembly protein TraF